MKRFLGWILCVVSNKSELVNPFYFEDFIG